MAQFLKHPTKKDFGLAKHRVTLPEVENESNSDTNSGPSIPETKNNKPNTSPFSKRISSMTGKVKNLFNKTEHQSGSPLLRHSPGLKREKLAHGQDFMSFDDNSRASPNLQYSRVVKKDMFADGIKSSLDSLKDQYSLIDDVDDMQEVSDDCILKLLLQSNNSNEQITIRRNSEGLGIRLSSGQFPVFVTQVEPDSEAMIAGIKVNDVILEVNGKDCRNMESTEISRLLQLKSLIKKSPYLRKGMKALLTISSIDDDIEESDDDAVFSPLQDQVSIDEDLFEYTSTDKDKFKPMPLLEEEKHLENDKSQVKELLVDLSEEDGTTSATDSSTKTDHNDKTGSGSKEKPTQKILTSKSVDFSLSVKKKDNTLDFKSIPTTQKLGGDVGRYKRDIGNARKRRPTKRRHSSVSEIRESNIFSDQSAESMKDEDKKTRSMSSSSVTSEREDKPIPKQKPPVALRIKSSSKDTSQTPTIEPEVIKRRYTIGSSLGQGSNTQLLAEAASARARLRSPSKGNIDKRNSGTEEQETVSKETTSQKEEPKWAKKQEKMTPSKLNSSLVGKDEISKAVNDNTQSFVVSTENSTNTILNTPVKTANDKTTPPPKPSRLRERLSSASEQDKTNSDDKKIKVTSEVEKSVVTKPIPTSKKVSKTDKTSEDQSEKNSKTNPPKIEISSDDHILSKPVPMPRKPSFKKINDTSQTDADKKVSQTSTVLTGNKPKPIKDKPQSITDKKIMEPKNELNKKTEDLKSNKDSTKGDQDSKSVKDASEAKEMAKPRQSGSVRSKLAMFEQR